jgi:hypothetical protein
VSNTSLTFLAEIDASTASLFSPQGPCQAEGDNGGRKFARPSTRPARSSSGKSPKLSQRGSR